MGRIAELAALAKAYEDAGKGRPHAVLIEGEAGIGKSRLIAESISRVRAAGGSAYVGRCADVDGGLPFGPIVEVLRELVQGRGERELPADARLLSPLLPEMGDPGTDNRPISRTALFHAVAGVLSGDETPLAVVIEDIHWSDRSTRELVRFLIDRFAGQRILLVLSLRTDESNPVAGLSAWLGELKRSPAVTTVQLGPLDRREAGRQIEEITGSRPPKALVDAIYKRSQGNPFFTEELLAAGSDASPSSLPSLADLFMGRIASLDEHVRDVLRAVAVAELSTSSDVIASTLDTGAQEVGSALRAAVANQVLVRREGDRYSFRHALLRDLFYEELTADERRRYHGAFATALEGLIHEQNAVSLSQVAHHWWHADEPERARRASLTAADAAEASLAYAEAMQHLIEAAGLSEDLALNDPPVEFLLERAATVARAEGEWERSVELLQQALGRVNRSEDPERAGHLMERIAWWDWWALGNFCVPLIEEALQLLPVEPPSSLRSRMLQNYGMQVEALGRVEEARALFAEALETARRAGDGIQEARARVLLGTTLTPGISPDMDPVLEALEFLKRCGSPDNFLEAGTRIGNALLYLGDLPRLITVMEEALATVEELQLHASWPGLYFLLAEALFLLGRWSEVDDYYERFRPGPHERLEAWHLLSSVLVRIGQGKLPEVARDLDAMEPIFKESTDAQEQANFLLATGLCHLWSGDLERAEIEASLAFELVEEHPHLASAEDVLLLIIQVGADRVAAGKSGPDESRRVERAIEQVREAELTEHDPISHVNRDWCEAEYSRAVGRSDPGSWAKVADGWARVQVPWYEGWARWRQAEALLSSRGTRAIATETLLRAHRLATELDATPLLAKVEELARRAGLTLPVVKAATVPDEPASSLDRFGLTRRELEVLRLVATGKSNPEIASELFISVKTASAHVSHILEKMGVSRRGEAAGLAHSMGLMTDHAETGR